MKARVFRSGNSQAVRLPKEFQLGVGEVEIFGITRSGIPADLDYTSAGAGPPLVLDVESGIGQVRVVRG